MTEFQSDSSHRAGFLAAFIAHAEKVEPVSPVLPIAYAAYALQGGLLLLVLVCLQLSNFTLGSGPFFALFCLLLWVSFSALVARRYGMPRIAGFLESVSFASVGGVLTVCATFMAASISGALADDWLIATDRMLGFDWEAVYRFSRQFPTAVYILNLCYFSMALQTVVLPFLLFLTGQEKLMWTFLTAWVFALAVTIAVFPFAPAEGAAIRFGIHPDALSKAWFWEFGPRIKALQDGSVRNIGSAAMGIVSIPSFHAAAGIMFTWFARNLPYVGWPLVGVNVGMIVSTPISGVHYLIDVIAGIMVGCLSIVVAQRLAAKHR